MWIYIYLGHLKVKTIKISNWKLFNLFNDPVIECISTSAKDFLHSTYYAHQFINMISGTLSTSFPQYIISVVCGIRKCSIKSMMRVIFYKYKCCSFLWENHVYGSSCIMQGQKLAEVKDLYMIQVILETSCSMLCYLSE